MALEIFKLVGGIFVDNDKANESIDNTDKRANNLAGSFLKGVGTAAKWGAGIATAAGGMAVTAGAALKGLTEDTREYRNDMALLETAFVNTGKSADSASATYKSLNGILGDSGQAVEASQHLAMLCKSEEQLASWTDICTGVYATFGASLPIEGLTEAANETAKVGQVTGGLADALNWIGISEDKFNESLEKCNSEQERAALITDTLNNAYKNASNTFKETNADVIASNNAQENLRSTMAGLASTVEPLLTKVTIALTGVLASIMPIITNLAEQLLPIINNLIEQLLPIILDLITQLMPFVMQICDMFLPVMVNLLSLLLPPFIEIVQVLLPPLLDLVIALNPLIDVVLQLLEPILQLLVEIMPAISQLISYAVVPLVQILVQLINIGIKPTIEQFRLFSNIIAAVMGFVIGVVTGDINIVKNAFLNLHSYLSSLWSRIRNTFINLGANMGNAISSALKSAVNSMFSTIEKRINFFIGLINGAIKIINKIPGVKLSRIGTISFPRLASGHVATESMIAEVGEYSNAKQNPEIIAPQSILRETYRAEMNVFATSQKDYFDNIIELLEVLITKCNRPVVLDSGALVGEIAEPMDAALGNILNKRKRGR